MDVGEGGRQERTKIALHLSDDGEDGAQLLVDHEPEDAHHGRASVVELDGALAELRLLVEGIPSEVDGAVAEVADEFVLAGDVLHDAELEESDEGEDLGESGGGDGIGTEEGGDAVGVGIEGMSGIIDVAGEVESGAGGDLSEERELADASVLELDEAKAIESVLIGIVEEAERIEESEGRLGAELVLEGAEGGRRLGDGSGRECGGGADEGGDDGGLHVLGFRRLRDTMGGL